VEDNYAVFISVFCINAVEPRSSTHIVYIPPYYLGYCQPVHIRAWDFVLPSPLVSSAAETLIEATEASSIRVPASRAIFVIASVEKEPQGVGKRRAPSPQAPCHSLLYPLRWESFSTGNQKNTSP
jgi:hypothetical protein